MVNMKNFMVHTNLKLLNLTCYILSWFLDVWGVIWALIKPTLQSYTLAWINLATLIVADNCSFLFKLALEGQIVSLGLKF